MIKAFMLMRRKKIVIAIGLASIIVILLVPKILFTNNSIVSNFFEDSQAYCNKAADVTGDEGRNLQGYELLQVQVIIRHGDRAPIELDALPNTSPVHIPCMFHKQAETNYGTLMQRFEKVMSKSPFLVVNSKNTELVQQSIYCKGGQLTPHGYLQHLFLGKYLKFRYKVFLENLTVDRDILVKSTDVARTIQSAAALLSELFYDYKKDHSVIIYVYNDQVADGHMLLDENNQNLACHKLPEIMSFFEKKSKTWKEFVNKLFPILKSIANVLHIEKKDLPPINRVVDILYSRLCHNKGVPRGPGEKLSSKIVKDAFKVAHEYTIVKHGAVAEHQSLSILSQMAKHAFDIIIGKASKKFVLFSGHDSMITPFLMLLEIYDGKWPPYASRVVVEFYLKSNTTASVKQKIENTFFRVIYNGVIAKKISFCKSSDFETLCSLLALFDYVSNGSFNINGDLSRKNVYKILFTRIKYICE
ncbi:counting factor 60 isoform X2 [Hydra vulgaris]|uniref:2-phosphoxylose phosphatase 1 n=1 Tax=Hydra vulgaris TaxID=6087 RepID=A0ABM4D3Z7_HYDVU